MGCTWGTGSLGLGINCRRGGSPELSGRGAQSSTLLNRVHTELDTWLQCYPFDEELPCAGHSRQLRKRRLNSALLRMHLHERSQRAQRLAEEPGANGCSPRFLAAAARIVEVGLREFQDVKDLPRGGVGWGGGGDGATVPSSLCGANGITVT